MVYGFKCGYLQRVPELNPQSHKVVFLKSDFPFHQTCSPCSINDGDAAGLASALAQASCLTLLNLSEVNASLRYLGLSFDRGLMHGAYVCDFSAE